MTTDKSTIALGVITAAALSGGAYMWWKGRQMKRPPLTGSTTPKTPEPKKPATSTTEPKKSTSNVIWSPLGPILTKPINVSLKQQEIIEVLPAAEKNNAILWTPAGPILKKPPLNPKYTPIREIIDSPKTPNSGLLGKLVAYHWALWNLRYKYMDSYLQYGYNDDTYQWYYGRECNLFIGEEDYPKWNKNFTRDSTFPMYALPIRCEEKRFSLLRDGTTINIEDYLSYQGLCIRGPLGPIYVKSDISANGRIKGTSLERTFSNYSRISIPGFIKYEGTVPNEKDVNFKPFKAIMGSGRAGVVNNYGYFHEFGYVDNNDYNDYSDFGSGAYGGESWDNIAHGKHILIGDRLWNRSLPAYLKYEIHPMEGLSWGSIARRLSNYYERGYFLVLAALDVLIGKRLNVESPDHVSLAFQKHCNDWGIPIPTMNLITSLPNLSMIGGAPTGFTDVSAKQLTEFVMSITPKPGSIEPWNDPGPLWGWPNELGIMQPLTPHVEYRDHSIEAGRNKKVTGEPWINLAGFIINAEAAFCSAGLGSAASGVVDAAMSAATNTMTAWAGDALSGFLNKLEDVLSSGAFQNVLGVLADGSQFAASVERFIGGQQHFGEALGLSEKITRMDAGVVNDIVDCVNYAVDGTDAEIKRAKNNLNARLDVLRDSWEWTDDVVSPICGYGNEFTAAIRK